MKKIVFKEKYNTTSSVCTNINCIPFEGSKYLGPRIKNGITVERLGNKIKFSRFGCDSVSLNFESSIGSDLVEIPHLVEDYKIIIQPSLVKFMVQTVSTLGKVLNRPEGKVISKTFLFTQNLTKEMIESKVIILANTSKVSIEML
jgi:hypothetical protein